MDSNREPVEHTSSSAGQTGADPDVVTAKLRLALADTETGCWEWNPDTGAVHLDEHAAALFGYEPDESRRTAEDLVGRIHPDDRDEIERACERALTEGRYDTEFRVAGDGLAERWLRARAVTVTTGDEARKLVGVATDITDGKYEELERFRTFVEHAPDGLTHIRPDGTMTYVSGGERVLGRSSDEFVGKPLETFIHPEDERNALEFFDAVRAGGDPPPFEGRIRHGDGSWLWIETTAITLDEPSNVEGFLTVTRSIAERKKYERRIEDQRDDLEILNEVFRHDIRNDLQVIDGNAALLEDDVDGVDRKHLDTIRASTTNAVDLTRQARELSEAMLRMDDELEAVRVSPVLEAQVEEVRTAYPDADVSIDGSLPDVSVVANELLEAIFRNLLKNAIQHNDSASPTVRVAVEDASDGIEVRIADDGSGVSDSRKDAIFDKTEKGVKSEGTGIGLYLVESLVERYGGTVRIEDGEPDGAVFVVRLTEAE